MKSIIFFALILICFISCKKTDITPMKPTVSKSTNTTSYNENTNSYKTDDIPETDVVGDRRNCGWITVMEGTGGGGDRSDRNDGTEQQGADHGSFLGR